MQREVPTNIQALKLLLQADEIQDIFRPGEIFTDIGGSNHKDDATYKLMHLEKSKRFFILLITRVSLCDIMVVIWATDAIENTTFAWWVLVGSKLS